MPVNRIFISSFLLGSLLLVQAVSISSAAHAMNAGTHFNRALQYQYAGDSDNAIMEYKKGLEIAPDSADAHAKLGALLMDDRGDLDGAISELFTAVTLDPNCFYCKQKLDEAVDKRNAPAREALLRANEFYRSGALNRAVANYRIATQADPKSGEAHNSLAWSLYRTGNLKEAKAEVLEALGLQPDEPEYVNTLACIQYDEGNLDSAMESWKKAIGKSKTANPADLYGLAIGFLSKGQTELAVKNFKEAIKTDPNYTNVNYLRDRIGMSIRALANHDKLVSLAGEK